MSGKQKHCRDAAVIPKSIAARQLETTRFDVDDHENHLHEAGEVDEMMTWMRRAARDGRVALESLEGKACTNVAESRGSRTNRHPHSNRGPSTAGAKHPKSYSRPLVVDTHSQQRMRRYSYSGVNYACDADHHLEQPTRPISSHAKPLARLKVKPAPTFLTGISYMSGHARKIDRCVILGMVTWLCDTVLANHMRMESKLESAL